MAGASAGGPAAGSWVPTQFRPDPIQHNDRQQQLPLVRVGLCYGQDPLFPTQNLRSTRGGVWANRPMGPTNGPQALAVPLQLMAGSPGQRLSQEVTRQMVAGARALWTRLSFYQTVNR